MPFFQQFPKTLFDFESNGINTDIIDIFRFVKAQNLYTDNLSVYTYYQVKNGDRPDVVSNLLYKTPDYYWTFFVLNEHLKTGLSGWPMSPDAFEQYIEQEYTGTVIMTNPYIVRDGDKRITEYRNSLAGTTPPIPGSSTFGGKFKIGETVVGSESGASGIVHKIDVQLSQLILKNVIVGPFGYFKANELIVGQTTSTSVTSYLVFDYRNAPHHYLLEDGTISYNALHINESSLFVNGQVEPNYDIDPNISNSELIPVSNYAYETELNDERSNITVVRPEVIYDFVKTFKEKLNA